MISVELTSEVRMSCGMDNDVNTLVAHKWVRIMCDSSAEAVWDIDGASCGLYDLPVSLALLQALLLWQEAYDHAEILMDEGRHTDFDVEAFSRYGLHLARMIKTALPDWTVIYWDEAKASRSESTDRRVFEYEVQPYKGGAYDVLVSPSSAE